jgi:hypothetical protein
MDILKQYLETAAGVIGERTPGEERYDRFFGQTVSSEVLALGLSRE